MSFLGKDIQRIMRGQSLVEYVILIMLVTLALSAMFTLSKRATQSLIKAGADQIGNQEGAEQSFNREEGYLVSSNTVSSGSVSHRTDFSAQRIGYVVADVTRTNTVSLSVAGEKEAGK